MMYPKLAIISDVHVDLYQFDNLFAVHFNKPEHKEMILCLAGDISTDTSPDVEYFKQFAEKCAQYFKHVVFVLGNHDCWGHDLLGDNNIDHKMSAILNGNERIHYLTMDDTVVIDGIEFWGHTFWSKIESPLEQTQIQSLNDYRCIYSSNKEPLYVLHTNLINSRARNCLKNFLNSPNDNQAFGTNKRVVMTHFPLFREKIPEYPNVFDIYYNNHMDYELSYSPQPDVYIFGHTHTPFDFDFMGARVICNPRGYPSQSKSFEMKYIDLNIKEDAKDS